MKTILILKAFKFAHAGIHVEEFQPSAEPVETSDECAELAIKEKWAKAHAPRANKNAGDAPANKSAAVPADPAELDAPAGAPVADAGEPPTA